MTDMQPPLSPPLADLHTNFSDLTLLEESDDLLSPSVLGAAAASKVRAARSPVKGSFRARNGIPRARSSSLSTPASLQTLEEEDEAHDGADDSPPLPAVPSQLPQPRRCESPPDTPDASAPAAASTSRFSPALAAMQASVAASRHVDVEVRHSPGLLDSVDLAALCTPPAGLPTPGLQPRSTGSRSTVPRRTPGQQTPQSVPPYCLRTPQSGNMSAAADWGTPQRQPSPAQAASLRASLAAGAHFDAEARLSPGLLTGAELAALGTPPPAASDAPSPRSIPRPQLAGKPGAAAAAPPSRQRSRIPRPAGAVPTGRLASGSAAAPARQAKAAAVGARHSSAVAPAAAAATGARTQLPSALRAPQGGGSSRPAPARRPGPPAAAAATKVPRVSLVDRQRSGPAAVSTAGRAGPAGREASSARAASSSCAPARAAAAPAGRHANPQAGASRIPGPAGRGRGRGPRVPPQPPPQPAEEAAPPAEVPTSKPISPATLDRLMAEEALAFQPKKQLLAVTPEGSPGPGGGAAQKRKTAEERQWEAWATPPDGRQ